MCYKLGKKGGAGFFAFPNDLLLDRGSGLAPHFRAPWPLAPTEFLFAPPSARDFL